MLTSPLNESEVELWDHIYAFLFVAGAALETMLKAAAMQAEINKRRSFDAILTPRRELQGWVLKHKLVAFAERAGIPLSEDEKAQLERFTKYVVWAGRYPVPTHVRDPRKNAVVLYDFHVSNFDRVWFDRLYKSAHESYQHHASEFGAGTSDRGQKKH